MRCSNKTCLPLLLGEGKYMTYVGVNMVSFAPAYNADRTLGLGMIVDLRLSLLSQDDKVD